MFIHEKVRKDHNCRLCGDIIKSGEVERSKGLQTLHFHKVCWNYSREWSESDWEKIKPGDISLDDILEEILEYFDRSLK